MGNMERMKVFLQKATLILIGLSGYASVVLITPVLSDMGTDFPTVSTTTLALVVTIPTITILFGLGASAYLCTKVHKKTIAVVALSMVCIFGGLPYFLHSIDLIILSRAFLGLCVGILTPLQASYFAEYLPEERAALFGYNSVVNGLLTAGLFMLIAVFKLTWRKTFLLFGFFALILVLVVFVLPKGEIVQAGEQAKAEVAKGGLRSAKFIYFCVAVVIVMASYLVVPTTVSLYLTENGAGGIQEAGLLSSAGTICMAVMGLLYPFLRKLLKMRLTAFVLLLQIAGCVVYAFPNSFVLLFTGFILIATGSSVFSLEASMQMTELVPLALVAVGSAVLTSFIFIGQFLSTYYQPILMKAAGLNEMSGSYWIMATVLGVLWLIDVYMGRAKK